MAKTKYKPIYKKKLLDYFLKFIDLRDDPDLSDGANRHGMISLVISDEGAEKQTKPSTGYPTLTKFAIKIGVSPAIGEESSRTLTKLASLPRRSLMTLSMRERLQALSTAESL